MLNEKISSPKTYISSSDAWLEQAITFSTINLVATH